MRQQVANLAVTGSRLEVVGQYAYATQARSRARHEAPGLYEIYSDRTGQLLGRFEVCLDGDLVTIYPEPEPPEPMIAALFAA